MTLLLDKFDNKNVIIKNYAYTYYYGTNKNNTIPTYTTYTNTATT